MPSAWDNLLNNKNITQLPHYAINKSLPADSYFTSSSTAKKCFDLLQDTINTDGYVFIEPSAGSGAFYDLLPSERRIGIELHSRRTEFIQQDYLTWYPSNENEKYIVIGNPPFGVRGAYALAFINRSFLFCDYISFVLPMSFHSNGKGSNMKRVKNGHLIFSKILENEDFYSPDNGKTVRVNTLFQIWKKGEGESVFDDYDVSKYADIYTVCSSPDRLCGLDKVDRYDFFVSSSFFGDNLNTVYKFEDVKYGSGYGIILRDKKDEILTGIKDINWNQYASMATNSCKHVRKHSIEQCLFDLGFGKKQKTSSLMDFME
jgi:hypothetical protein